MVIVTVGLQLQYRVYRHQGNTNHKAMALEWMVIVTVGLQLQYRVYRYQGNTNHKPMALEWMVIVTVELQLQYRVYRYQGNTNHKPMALEWMVIVTVELQLQYRVYRHQGNTNHKPMALEWMVIVTVGLQLQYRVYRYQGNTNHKPMALEWMVIVTVGLQLQYRVYRHQGNTNHKAMALEWMELPLPHNTPTPVKRNLEALFSISPANTLIINYEFAYIQLIACPRKDYNSVLVGGMCQIPDPLYKLIGSIVSFYIPLVVMLLTYALTVRLLAVQEHNLSSNSWSSGWLGGPASTGIDLRTPAFCQPTEDFGEEDANGLIIEEN
ncbi:hypothetical protein J6590_051331 [Homalodisca vitripennis]|nr:hypothetical protein J6590_051331 [Homalodisca vitripennis]